MAILNALAWVNTWILRAGRLVGWVALALMVVVILTQVFCRYVLNSALPWPDEGARFLMLWMTGLMAPSAYRWGGFVAIDMLGSALPSRLGAMLNLVLLVMSLAVLLIAVSHGYNHTMGFGGNFNSSSLVLPFDWVGLEAIKVKLRYMYGSLFLCVLLLISVNIELLMRTVFLLINPNATLPDDDSFGVAMEAD
ncbi:TRAP transporter small permease [Shimia abyssi]|uniref:TRAP transporter small permease protein n=1 Tax=Shimia abyssi TaxID=1662395 RepID=A0A2P8F9R4_9RHOB|nr:TRAP transporter small permease subunit [Shimia abyssi]PSL18450.1 TRAP-type C4-dicarboxylate transport system permease small subunit [Shimia abyssi]